jgi:tetratricopeptide (TPR) repeat protein/DNA-binding CsgD family transcriptional regulator
MMIPSLKNCSWKFRQTLICLGFLLAFISVSGQVKHCSYQNFWFKADYKNLKHAETEKNRYAPIITTKGLQDTVYAKAYDVTGLYYDFAGNSEDALSNFKKALSLLRKYPAKQIAPMVNIATENNILGKFDTALKWSKKALALNDKYGNDINKAHIYHSMAASYLYKGDLEKATSYVLKGIKILEAKNDKCYLGQLKLTLAGTYLQSNNYRFAADLIEEYLAQNKNDKDSKIYAIATVNYSENLIELGQKDKAYTLLTELVPNVRKSGDKELEAVLYSRLANIENLRGNTQKSLYHYSRAYELLSEKKSKYSMLIFSSYIAVLNEAKKYDEAIKLINEFRNSPAYIKSHTQERYEYERSIAEIYTETGNWKESAKAFERAMLMCDTLRMHENGTTLNAMQAQFQTDFQREKNQMLANNNLSLKKKVETERRLIFMYIIASLGLITLILVLLRGYWLKTRLQKEELKSVATEKNYLEQQHALEQELSNSQKQMIDEKQREVTSMALQMANYYDNLHSVIEKLDNETFSKPGDVKKELQQLTRQKDYWKEFELRFKNANPDFESKLITRFPMLTKNDIQFCSLLKLNLSYKEIASLLQISYESAVTKKYRIKKKIGIMEDEDFERLLLSI